MDPAIYFLESLILVRQKYIHTFLDYETSATITYICSKTSHDVTQQYCPTFSPLAANNSNGIESRARVQTMQVLQTLPTRPMFVLQSSTNPLVRLSSRRKKTFSTNFFYVCVTL